jgi:hypothetical protein
VPCKKPVVSLIIVAGSWHGELREHSNQLADIGVMVISAQLHIVRFCDEHVQPAARSGC